MGQIYYDGAMRDTVSSFDVRRAIKDRDGVDIGPGKLSHHIAERGSFFEQLGGYVERAPSAFVIVRQERKTA